MATKRPKCRECKDKVPAYDLEDGLCGPCYTAAEWASFQALPPSARLEVAELDDGEGLLYAGTTTAIAGAWESGKTWAALALAQHAALTIWLDFEAQRSTLDRVLMTPGLDERTIRVLDGRPLLDDRGEADGEYYEASPREKFLRTKPVAKSSLWAVVVLDSASSAECPADGRSVIDWRRRMVEPWLEKNCAVVILDHTPASGERRMLGSTLKAAFADTVYITRPKRDLRTRRLRSVALETYKRRDEGLPGDMLVSFGPEGLGVACAEEADIEAHPPMDETVAFEKVARGELGKREACRLLGSMEWSTFRGRYNRWADEHGSAQ